MLNVNLVPIEMDTRIPDELAHDDCNGACGTCTSRLCDEPEHAIGLHAWVCGVGEGVGPYPQEVDDWIDAKY